MKAEELMASRQWPSSNGAAQGLSEPGEHGVCAGPQDPRAEGEVVE